ncbi:MAG: hypothetical protein A2516_09710 [Alphaproteobacteria bacterium RIFOXYD12_FULL_60_8]|nr:MAG: hypothetical protein A2516_09710 [Alphaproteobacteria bacterium RIFOXYD12_FULL_60_8]
MTLLTATVVLFLIMDPMGNAPVFLAVLAKTPASRRRWVILRESIIALVILILFLFFGSQLLGAMDISLPALSISGGVVLFFVALRMIFPHVGDGAEPPEFEPMIVPLAMPLIAGPAALTMVMVLASREPERMLDWLTALGLAWAASSLMLVFSDTLTALLREQGVRAVVRLMGMILTAMAVQMLLNGVRQFLASLPQV